MNKEEAVNFIADLIFSIDPLVFTGNGTEYQNEYVKCMESENSASCLDSEDKYINDFICSCNISELLDTMIDILINRPTQYLNDAATRRKDDWDYYVNLVIAKISDKMPDMANEKLSNLLITNSNKRKDIIEILSYMDFNKSYAMSKRIYEKYDDLTESEVELINEIFQKA